MRQKNIGRTFGIVTISTKLSKTNMTRNHMTKKPIIGVTLDAQMPGKYSAMPWYALRQNYCNAVLKAGGVPLPLPHHLELAEHYAAMLDGVLITGGDFDIPPHVYGVDEIHEKTSPTAPGRTAFEWRVIELLLEQDKPVLGICGGMQLLNVVLGGTLIQHIPDQAPSSIAHEQPNPRYEPGHDITIHKNTKLHAISNTESAIINSAHHQAIEKVAPGLIINAKAADGLIEGIECPKRSFCLGVQWHPEYHVDTVDGLIFDAFIKAATR